MTSHHAFAALAGCTAIAPSPTGRTARHAAKPLNALLASLGLAAGVIGKQVYAEVLLMVLLTTVLAPLVLRALAPRPERDAPAA